MANDIELKLGLDATELFQGIDQALSKARSEISSLPGVGESLGKGVPDAKKKLSDFIAEQKQVLVQMKLSGNQGDDAYAKVEQAIKDAQQEMKKLDDAIQEVDSSLQDSGGSAQSFGDQLKNGIMGTIGGGALSAFIGGSLAEGVQAGLGVIVDSFGAVIDKGRALISAQGDLKAVTGATGAEFEALSKEAEKAFVGGVGESLADATKVIANAKVVLKDALPTDQIGDFTAKAQALGNLYEKDVNEVIAKSTPFIKQFGLQGDEAFNLIAYAAKEGKTSQDDVLDTLAEYSQLLDEAGFSAQEFAGSIAVAGQEGLFNTDKIADSIKEAQIRLKAGDTAKAFADIQGQLPKALGTTLGSLEKLASSGQISIKEFLQKSGESIKTAFDSGQISEAMAAQLQVAVAGTPAEDIGVQAYNKLFGAPLPVDEISKKAAEAGKAASGAVGQYLSFDAVGRQLSMAFEKASASVVGVLSDAFGMIATAIAPTFEKLSNSISGYFTRIWSVIGPILSFIGASIIANITYALNMAMTVLDIFYNIGISVFDGIWKAIEPVVSVFQQLGKTIGEALGFGGEAGESIDFMKTFQDILTNVSGVVSFLGSVISDILGGAISLLFTPLQLLGQAIGAVIGYIVDWISKSGIINGIINGVTATVDFFKGIIDAVSNAFNTLIGYVQDVINFFGIMNSTVNDGKGFMDSFYGAVDSVWQIVKNVATAIYDFGANILTKYLIEPIKAGIDWISKIVTKIKDWVLSFDSVQKAVQIVQNVANGVRDFFSNISQYIGIVKVNIGGIVYALNEVGKLAGEFFSKIASADFSGAYNVVANSIDRIGQAYDTGKSKAQAFLNEQAKQEKLMNSLKEIAGRPVPEVKPTVKPVITKTEDKDTKDKDDKDKKDKDKEKQKTADNRTELQKRQEDFKDFLQGQQNARDTDFLNFKGSEDEKSLALKQRLQKDAEEAQKKLNEIARDVSDTEFNPIEIKIKPEKGENLEDVKQFYIGEFKKLTEAIEKNAIKIPVDLSWRDPLVKDLEEFVKESDTNAKEYEKIMAGMFTKPVNTEAKLDKAQDDFDKITDLLYLTNVELGEKIDLARSIGDQKAVESLEKIRGTNSEAIADTERRYARFVADSKKAIDQNTIYFQIGKSLELSIQKAFDGEKLKQEREAQQKIRDEKLASLGAEEEDLKKSLANRSIDFAEYAARMGEIERERNEASKDTGSEFLSAVKGASDSAIATVLKSQADMFTENAKEMEGNEKVFNEFVGQALGGFSELAASGKATLLDFGKMAAGAAFDAVAKMIPSFVTGILGSSITTLGPILGPLAAATLTGALYGLLGLARSAAGFKDGVVNLEGAGSETSDSIPAWLSKGESVITAKATKENRAELEWMNKTGLSVSHFYKQKIQSGSLSVNSDGELIEEVRRLRAETRSLGSRISRNTKVEVSGLLSADSRSITAIINSERKRKMRRG